ncbi:hypothetical protein KOW79_017711 [Hemibagrus wyckioides]|uniref:Uncharacterized protein n=1 Tax=Hemibagrus wyckioides TaxID=337641 RepID=A0A9D3SCN6_9TELE|nr:hypothetical protein KOW79_017711 [Hemibagrus wyckioides]
MYGRVLRSSGGRRSRHFKALLHNVLLREQKDAEATGQKAHQDVKQLQTLLKFQGSPQTQSTSDLLVQALSERRGGFPHAPPSANPQRVTSAERQRAPRSDRVSGRTWRSPQLLLEISEGTVLQRQAPNSDLHPQNHQNPLEPSDATLNTITSHSSVCFGCDDKTKAVCLLYRTF